MFTLYRVVGQVQCCQKQPSCRLLVNDGTDLLSSGNANVCILAKAIERCQVSWRSWLTSPLGICDLSTPVIFNVLRCKRLSSEFSP